MSRYIDADKLIEKITDYCKRYLVDWNEQKAIAWINGEETADVVEVVRCSECELHNFCATEDIFLFSGISDGYCRVGKRKEDNEKR